MPNHGGQAHEGQILVGNADKDEAHSPIVEDQECPVTHTFLEALNFVLCEDLQAVKKDLFSDLQEMGKDLDEVEERVALLKC
ncbi:hypothetical protein NDU88_004306 [Pleurodeles waltl]|uniref:Uncharacterized protein n=1 Tax=Pleurodeles waltl TaxID=8319 RepID=A0AAV7M6S6_PLEWA|nr:hypothetical protein NDU88_004306 [Pleurodeles waltl]